MKLIAIFDTYSEEFHTLPDLKISLIVKAPANTDQGRQIRKELFKILSTHLTERKPLLLDISNMVDEMELK